MVPARNVPSLPIRILSHFYIHNDSKAAFADVYESREETAPARLQTSPLVAQVADGLFGLRMLLDLECAGCEQLMS